MRIPNRHAGDVVVESLTISNIYAGYLEGGPDGASLLGALRGYRDNERATCVRWDKTILPATSSSLIMMRVPRWMYRATISFRDPDDDVADRAKAVVAWLAEGIGPASLEETLLAGLGDVDLASDVAPIAYGQGKRRGIVVAHVDGGVAGDIAIEARGWRFDFGPRAITFADVSTLLFRDGVASHVSSVDVPVGSALVRSSLRGPPLGDHGDERRSGQWQSSLDFVAVVAMGREPLEGVLSAAMSKVDWRRHAHEWFDDWDDY